MFLGSISRVAVGRYFGNIRHKVPSLLSVTFKYIKDLDIHAYDKPSTSRFGIITVTTRTMSDAISKETDEDTRQKKGEEDGDCGTSSPKDETVTDETTTNERSSEGKASEEESKPLTRDRLFKKSQQTVKEFKDKFLSMPQNEKRKLYKCKGKFVLLDSIQTWPDFFEGELLEDEDVRRWWKRNKKNVTHEVKESLNNKISLFRGDITALEIDAITNAANESLLGGGGVDGAIHAAAGPHLRSECELLNGCNGGEAKITCGYKLPAKYVIHTVGPRGEHPDILESCYKQSLDLMKENQLKSVAFPCISTGIFGYPNEKAAIVALRTVRNWLDTDDYAENIERIIFCLFLEKDLDVYHRQTQIFFPLDQDSASGTND